MYSEIKPERAVLSHSCQCSKSETSDLLLGCSFSFLIHKQSPLEKKGDIEGKVQLYPFACLPVDFNGLSCFKAEGGRTTLKGAVCSDPKQHCQSLKCCSAGYRLGLKPSKRGNKLLSELEDKTRTRERKKVQGAIH